MRSSQWITCSLSYPHDVKKDGYLLLRLLETSCFGLDNYVQQATIKDTHFRKNMGGERSGVRQMIEKRKTVPPPYLVNLSDDDEVVIVEQLRPKRPAEDDTNITTVHCSANIPTLPVQVPLVPDTHPLPLFIATALYLSLPSRDHHPSPQCHLAPLHLYQQWKISTCQRSSSGQKECTQ